MRHVKLKPQLRNCLSRAADQRSVARCGNCESRMTRSEGAIVPRKPHLLQQSRRSTNRGSYLKLTQDWVTKRCDGSRRRKWCSPPKRTASKQNNSVPIFGAKGSNGGRQAFAGGFTIN